MGRCRCVWSEYNSNCDWLLIDPTEFWKECEEKIKHSFTLFSARTMNLGATGSPSIILHMGLNPIKRFDFLVRIECQKTQNYFNFNADQFISLLHYLEELSRIDIPHPSTIFSTKYVNPLLSCTTYYDQTYVIKYLTKFMKIDDDTLNQLLKLKPFILDFIKRCKMKKDEYEKCFIKTMSVYCMNKTVREILSVENQYDFLVQSSQLSCGCAPIHRFLFDLAINLEEWVKRCLPIFVYECVMYHEILRYLSFKPSKYHNRKDFEFYAMSGLFQVGTSNSTMQCAFCRVPILGEDNQSNEDIIKNHFEKSSKCQLLIDPRITKNVPIEKTNHELKKIFDRYIGIKNLNHTY